MSDIVESVRMRLFDLQDLDYKAFHCKLMPTVPPEAVIGVRTPEIRQLLRMLPESLGAEQVAGGPVVHIGQEFLQRLHRLPVVPQQ